MAKKAPPQEESGGGEWMNTYADLVTLLFAFFVMLFAMSNVDQEKWEGFKASMTGRRLMVIEPLDPGAYAHGLEAIDSQLPSSNPNDPRATPVPTKSPEGEGEGETEKVFIELFDKIANHIESNNLESELALEWRDETILLTMRDSALFDTGDTAIRPDSQETLLEVGLIFQEYINYIDRIEIIGHTDNRPINTARFRNNRWLSSGRANAVMDFFMSYLEIEESVYSIQGKGEIEPVDTNDTPEGRQKNRRVEFILIGKIDQEVNGQ